MHDAAARLAVTTRRVALTHAGELFLARARQVLAQLDAARGDLAELSAVRRGRVRIGATQVLGSLDLSASLASFRHRYPGVSLAQRTGLIAKLLGLLAPEHPSIGLIRARGRPLTPAARAFADHLARTAGPAAGGRRPRGDD